MSIVDFGLSLLVMVALMGYYHFMPHIMGLILIPLLLFFSFITAVGGGLFLSAVNAKFRDVRYVLPFFIQMLLFVTPVIYPISMIPERYQWILFLNPMTGIITLSRFAFLGSGALNINLLFLSLIASIVIFIFGLTYFKKTERFFADVI